MLIPWSRSNAKFATSQRRSFKAALSRRDDSDTKLLIHSNTTDGSTTFADSSGSSHTVSVGAADVEHDTAQKKFGTSSILFDGDSGYLSVADHADWHMGTGKFTVDFWVRLKDKSTSGKGALFEQYDAGTDLVSCSYWGSSTNLTFAIRSGGYPNIVTLTYIWSAVEENRWYHIAVIRGWASNANDWALCIDGIAVDTTTDTDAWPNLSAAFTIGQGQFSTPDGYLDGWIDEFRVTKGVARWTKNFTPSYWAY